jgi:hypothetical protein
VLEANGESGRRKRGKRDVQEEKENDPSSEDDSPKPFAVAEGGGGAGERGAGIPAAVGKDRQRS